MSCTSASGLPACELATYARTVSAIFAFGIQAPNHLALGRRAILASSALRLPVALA